MGAERRFFFAALLVGAVAFNFFGSLIGGLSLFGALHAIACGITAQDPQLPRILLNSSGLPRLYDPLTAAPWRAPRSRRTRDD